MRVKIVNNYKQYKKGEVVDVSPNVAFGLVDSGNAIISKDMTNDDIKESNNGGSIRLRTNKRSRR